MRKLKFPLSCAAAAVLLAACGGYEPVTPAPQATTYTQPAYTTPVVVAPAAVAPPVVAAPGTVVVPQQAVVVATTPALQPGYGRVDSITPMGSGTRVAVRMEHGQRVQYLDTPGGTMVALGQRVEVTADGHMSYPVPDRR